MPEVAREPVTNVAARDLFGFGPAPMSWRDNLRLTSPVFLALIGFSAVGRFVQGLLVALGAYIVLFGAGQPGRRRLRTFVVAAALLLGALSCGAVVAGSLPLLVLAYLGTAVIAVFGTVIVDLGPPGPYFFVLMIGGGTLLGLGGIGPPRLAPYVVLGSLLATAFGMADLLYDRYGAERRAVDAADRAVGDLDQEVRLAAGGTQAARRRSTMDRLGAAASAIFRAWAVVTEGLGSARSEPARRIADALLDTHRRYQRLYLRAVGTVLTGEGTTDSPGPTTGALATSVPMAVEDLGRTALGPPSLRYRLATELTWPSRALVTLARVAIATVASTVISGARGDLHPFWPVLVVVLVLSYPGNQRRLTLRAVQRLLGTLVGIGAFAVLLPMHLPTAAYVAVLCLLLWLVSRTTSRNYLIGSVFITLLALYMTVPLSPSQSPLALARDRGADTVVGAGLALAAVWLLGPQLTVPLATRSIRRLAQASIAVLEAVAQHRPLAEPQFVEHRRRLEHGLFDAGSALDLAGPRTIRRAKPWLDLERTVAEVGYLVLGASWDPRVLLEIPGPTTVCHLLRPLASIGDGDLASVPSPDALSSAISQLVDNDGQDDPRE